MRLHRFFTDADISGKTVFLSEKDLVHQITRVLRIVKGDEIILCDTAGNDRQVRITALSKNKIEGEVVFIKKNSAEPQKYVALYCSILKKENFELVVQKAVETGVGEIVPLKTKRTVKTGISHDRLKKIAQEAAEQCGRARIPVIHESMEFFEAIQISSMSFPPPIRSRVNSSGNPDTLWRLPGEAWSGFAGDPRVKPEDDRENFATFSILFDTSGQDAKIFFQSEKIKSASAINVFIGPEGGWESDEAALARTAGCHILSLGPRILRAETAAIIATFLATSV